MNQQDKDVENYLNANSFVFSVKLVGETEKDGWKCDAWKVEFSKNRNYFLTDYNTGLGHRKSKFPMPSEIKGDKWAIEQWKKTYLKPAIPSAASVLYCILNDASALNSCFDYWCDNFGYDNDSRKTLEIYQTCCAIGHKINKVFSPQDVSALLEILQDY